VGGRSLWLKFFLEHLFKKKNYNPWHVSSSTTSNMCYEFAEMWEYSQPDLARVNLWWLPGFNGYTSHVNLATEWVFTLSVWAQVRVSVVRSWQSTDEKKSVSREWSRILKSRSPNVGTVNNFLLPIFPNISFVLIHHFHMQIHTTEILLVLSKKARKLHFEERYV